MHRCRKNLIKVWMNRMCGMSSVLQLAVSGYMQIFRLHLSLSIFNSPWLKIPHIYCSSSLKFQSVSLKVSHSQGICNLSFSIGHNVNFHYFLAVSVFTNRVILLWSTSPLNQFIRKRVSRPIPNLEESC